MSLISSNHCHRFFFQLNPCYWSQVMNFFWKNIEKSAVFGLRRRSGWPTSFLYGFCLCFFNLPCLVPIYLIYMSSFWVIGFWEFQTSFSYWFCLCFVKISCLAPIGLYHKNLTIIYFPSFALPSQHFSSYEIEGF